MPGQRCHGGLSRSIFYCATDINSPHIPLYLTRHRPFLFIMGLEIEHKYLVADDSYKAMSESCHEIRQGYLSRIPERVVRVRIYDDRGYLTVKGLNHGDIRQEFEYAIPREDALEMLALCESPVIEKRRYIVPYGGFIWEVDEFINPRCPATAEIELPDSDTAYPLPPFVGNNVTGDPAYYNSNL